MEYEKKLEEYNKTHPTKKGDPDMPKKPATSYFLFTSDHRAEVKAKNPGISCFLVINNRNEGN